MTAVIRVFDAAGNVIETQKHKGDLKTAKVRQRRPRNRPYPIVSIGGLVR